MDFRSLVPFGPGAQLARRGAEDDPFTGFRREFDRAHDEGGLFLVTMHPHVITYRSRIWILEELIRHAKAKGGCWFATHAEIAAYVKGEAGL